MLKALAERLNAPVIETTNARGMLHDHALCVPASPSLVPVRALIGAGHLRLKTQGEKIVFVLGDPDYYKRFGFSHETAKAFACVYQGDHLQALRLAPDAPTAGDVIYPSAFTLLD